MGSLGGCCTGVSKGWKVSVGLCLCEGNRLSRGPRWSGLVIWIQLARVAVITVGVSWACVVSATWVLWHEHKNERSQHESENAENVECEEDGVVSATWVLWHEHMNERIQHESENAENVECEVSGMWEAFVGEPLRRRDRDGMKR
ncbi:hypothetical protein NDU88_001943 [Pleurodeles waltl]|uniref:Transmembrane protein n=1 Tax=Pleurodeles waltl TaxID=8319 RepID=A0AAV7LHG7_PLEWA|nr:hypothetical protein NDU88_001943 [Pleurodeles waltl]